MRQKHVYKTNEIAHLWANKKQEDARNSQGNFYFRGDTIYSYGSHFPIARHINNDVIFFTTRSYSNTTAKHINHVWYSIPQGKLIFRVQNVMSDPDNLSNLQYYLTEMEKLLKKIDKSLTSSSHLIEKFREYQAEFQYYGAHFKIKNSKLVNQWRKLINQLDSIIQKNTPKWNRAKERQDYYYAHRDEIELERRRKNEELNAHENALILNAWRDGKNVSINFWGAPTMLRVKDGIETTHGARVSLESARVLYEMIKAGRDIKGHIIDGYTVISINGSLKIGCHDIPLSEVDRMAIQLNWK